RLRRAVHEKAEGAAAAVLAEEDHRTREVSVLELGHRDEQRRRERSVWIHGAMLAAARGLVKRVRPSASGEAAAGAAARHASARAARALAAGDRLIVRFVDSQLPSL